MRSRLLIIAFCLLNCFVVASAQERAKRQLIVPLADGGFVAFKSETAWADAKTSTLNFQEMQGVFDTQALVDENHVIHRVLVDKAGKFIFGYDLVVEPRPAAKQFNIAVKPLDSQFENKLLARNSDQSSAANARISTLPQSAEPQLLEDGDSFALDLLINQYTGIKIVDVVKVSFDRSALWDTNPKNLPRDFTPDAVELSMNDYRLLINGDVVAFGKSGGCAGALIWFYLPGRGRFIFSLVPRERYEFQKVGVVDNDKIEFTIKGAHYEWISSAPVLRGGGVWNLWVLHDPNYTPLVADSSAEPKKKNKLEQIDSAVNDVKERAGRIRDQKQTTFHPDDKPQKQATKRVRLTIGAADRIENLWPK
jgi:hypothetical protein